MPFILPFPNVFFLLWIEGDGVTCTYRSFPYTHTHTGTKMRMLIPPHRDTHIRTRLINIPKYNIYQGPVCKGTRRRSCKIICDKMKEPVGKPLGGIYQTKKLQKLLMWIKLTWKKKASHVDFEREFNFECWLNVNKRIWEKKLVIDDLCYLKN